MDLCHKGGVVRRLAHAVEYEESTRIKADYKLYKEIECWVTSPSLTYQYGERGERIELDSSFSGRQVGLGGSGTCKSVVLTVLEPYIIISMSINRGPFR